jgi:hypothetical protein
MINGSLSLTQLSPDIDNRQPITENRILHPAQIAPSLIGVAGCAACCGRYCAGTSPYWYGEVRRLLRRVRLSA